MNTIVMNLENLAVTEYTPAATGLSGDYETTAAGLTKVGGLLDGAAKVLPSVTFGMALGNGARRSVPRYLYLFGTGLDGMAATVRTNDGTAHRYTAMMRHERAARFVLGRGIRDNYLQLKIDGGGRAALVIDQAEFVTNESTQRSL